MSEFFGVAMFKRQGSGGARKGARGFAALILPIHTESALGHHAAGLVEAGGVVGTDPGAVTAAHADVRVV